jgi:hypothetical protein
MEWVKLAAVPSYYLDAAILRAGEAAEVLFCRALAYCGSVESAGVVDKTVLPMLVPSKPQQRADALVQHGLWVDEGNQYRIRSWERWQDEHDVAAEKRRKDKERQRAYRRKRQTSDSHADCHSDSHAPKRDRHDVEGEGEREGETQPPTEVGAVADKPRRSTRIPDVFPFNEEHGQTLWTWALEHAPAVAIKPETENWQDYHRAKGDTAKDWTASWRTWMRRAQKDAERRPGSRLAVAGPQSRPSTTDAKVAQTLALAEQFAAKDAS